MTEITIVTLGREALMTVILVAGPVLGLGMFIGLLVSIFQATTQIQEQTLTFIPKILVVLLSVVAFGPWMLRILIDFAASLLGDLPRFIS